MPSAVYLRNILNQFLFIARNSVNATVHPVTHGGMLVNVMPIFGGTRCWLDVVVPLLFVLVLASPDCY